MHTLWLAALLACGTPPATPVEAPAPAPAPSPAPSVSPIADVVSAPDRDAADRALDEGRKPAEVLTFFQIEPGQKVLEIGSGGGYTAELLARAVGPMGHVWGHNSPFILERFAEAPWTARLQQPIMANVTRIDAPFDRPFPIAEPLDAVVDVLFYHDTVWMDVDRAAMNRNILAVLKSGGVYGIVDHAARPEDGLDVTKTLHRIHEQALIDEIVAAGFVLEASTDELRVPEDPRDWNASPGAAGERRGQSDRFVLRFRKP